MRLADPEHVMADGAQGFDGSPGKVLVGEEAHRYAPIRYTFSARSASDAYAKQARMSSSVSPG